MKLHALIGVFGLLSMVATTAEARPLRHIHHKPTVINQRVIVKPIPVYRPMNSFGNVRVVYTEVLPVGFRRLVHEGVTYYYHDGIYYIKESHGYVVVRPAAGLRIKSLPKGYVAIRVGDEDLYRYNEIDYRLDKGFYVVIQAP